MKSGWFCIALCCLLSAFFPLGAEEAVHWDRENLKVSWKKKISVSADSGGGVTAEFRTGSNPWPYFVLVPEKGKNWDFSRFRFISFAIENLDRERAVTGDICLGMWSRHKIGVFVLGPGEKRSFTYPLNHGGRSSFDPLFRAKGMPNGFEGGTNIDTSSVKCIHVICGFVRYGRFRISGIRLHGRYAPSPAIRSPETFFPFIDDYGQYCHEEWPEKIKSNRQLKESLRNEKSALKPRVADWDPWGGWKSGPRLKATGYFRVEKWEGKWYFADPDGRLFFSRGVNAWSRGEYWPTDRGKAKCYTRKSAAPGRVFHFYSDNCRIRYGNESWHDFQFRRMESWGYNTIGNWSDPALYRKRKMPYMLNLPLPSRKAMRFGPKNEFRDVYSPEFESELLNVLPEKFRWTIEDPYCIGYFVGNELHFGSSVEVAEAAFLASAELPAKRELIAGLRKKYGTIAALNKAWKGSWPSWDALACVETLPDAKGCRADFEAFSLKFWKRFFELSRQAVKKLKVQQGVLQAHCPGNISSNHNGILLLNLVPPMLLQPLDVVLPAAKYVHGLFPVQRKVQVRNNKQTHTQPPIPKASKTYSPVRSWEITWKNRSGLSRSSRSWTGALRPVRRSRASKLEKSSPVMQSACKASSTLAENL